MPKVPKTNYGIEWFKHKEAFGAGLPTISTPSEIVATIIDIKFPGENGDGKGSGVQARIVFDGFELKKKWFTLSTSAETILATIGNADAIRAIRPKVLLHYKNTNIESGIGTIICDNSQEEIMSDYQKNSTNNIVGTFSTLAHNTRPPGYR